jgi:hypothetical protein
VAGTRSKISQSCVDSLAFLSVDFFFLVSFVSNSELMIQLRKRNKNLKKKKNSSVLVDLKHHLILLVEEMLI